MRSATQPRRCISLLFLLCLISVLRKRICWRAHVATVPTGSSVIPRRTRLEVCLRAVLLKPAKSAVSFASENGFKMPTTIGQVLPDSNYGKVLQKMARRRDIQAVLETGTWIGSGSSLAIATGLKQSDGMLFTIEAVEEKWLLAEHHLRDFPVKCLLGVGVDSDALPSEEFAASQGGGGTGEESREVWSEWLRNERAVAETYPFGLIKPICEKLPIDFLHIDGGEFSGPAELSTALQYCKDLRLIALDDTGTFKNRENYRYLQHSNDWKMIEEDQKDRHGWAVFEHVRRS